jgi:hypothetical protein
MACAAGPDVLGVQQALMDLVRKHAALDSLPNLSGPMML